MGQVLNLIYALQGISDPSFVKIDVTRMCFETAQTTMAVNLWFTYMKKQHGMICVDRPTVANLHVGAYDFSEIVRKMKGVAK